MEWDKGAHGDIDLYVQDPTGAQCSFRFPVANFMHLDKDDLGASNDSVVNADGSVSTVRINREVITIRGIIEGEYIINAHYYSKRMWVDSRPGEVKKKFGVTGDSVIIADLANGEAMVVPRPGIAGGYILVTGSGSNHVGVETLIVGT